MVSCFPSHPTLLVIPMWFGIWASITLLHNDRYLWVLAHQQIVELLPRRFFSWGVQPWVNVIYIYIYISHYILIYICQSCQVKWNIIETCWKPSINWEEFSEYHPNCFVWVKSSMKNGMRVLIVPISPWTTSLRGYSPDVGEAPGRWGILLLLCPARLGAGESLGFVRRRDNNRANVLLVWTGRWFLQ